MQGEFVRPIKVEIGLSDGLMTEVRGEGFTMALSRRRCGAD